MTEYCSYCLLRKPTRINNATGEKVCEQCYDNILNDWELIKEKSSSKVEIINKTLRLSYLKKRNQT